MKTYHEDCPELLLRQFMVNRYSDLILNDSKSVVYHLKVRACLALSENKCLLSREEKEK